MDFLNPHKALRQRIILLTGYILIAVAIGIGTLVLLYQANGFNIGKNGTVIQNGLVYFSSQPQSATIAINGQRKATTNTRILLPADTYKVSLSRPGYRSWQRTIAVDGDSVEYFNYPFLFPTKLVTKSLQSYQTAPNFISQSPDRRWLVVQESGVSNTFDVYDLKNPTKAPTDITLPANIVSKATSSETWQVEEWADDNQHLVLEHIYDGQTEFILLDRSNPDQSVNLNKTFNTSPAKLNLINKKYDQYYLYDPASGNLTKASLSSPTPVPVLSDVLAYQSYGSNTLLYVTSTDAPSGSAILKLQNGSQTYTLHTFPAGSNYLLDLTEYSGTLYVVAGASSQNKVYIFPNPIGQLQSQPTHAVVPIQVLHVEQPNYVSFSDNAQFIVAENGNRFGVYDIENQAGYNYTTTSAIDAPQTHASWMDGDRLTYVSGGHLLVFDYDDTNPQTLMSASSNYLPVFAPDYSYVYGLAPSKTAGQLDLAQTALLIPADQ